MIQAKERASSAQQPEERRRLGRRVLSNPTLISLARNSADPAKHVEEWRNVPDDDQRDSFRLIFIGAVAFWAGLGIVVFK